MDASWAMYLVDCLLIFLKANPMEYIRYDKKKAA